jgi:hypothetical protein
MTDVSLRFNSLGLLKLNLSRVEEWKGRMRRGTPRRRSETACSLTREDKAELLNELPSCQSI